ncbi:MAG: oxidase [Chitinophagaceae bacterium]|nr:MAG: oxidase [Chitinophagaceae bacterium]
MQDILLNSNKELDMLNGDFVIGESTGQHQDLLVMTNKGEWKESPLIPVGAIGYLKDDNAAGLLAEIKTQFEKDGMTVRSIAMNGDNINTDAHY